MMWPSPFHPYEGGPTVIEWLKQVCDKFNELLSAVKNVRELPAGGSHGQVPTPREDGAGYEWVDQSGGGGGTSDLLWKPTVSSAGVISWARSSSTTPPASQNIKGPQGVAGPKGADGAKGPQGATGPQGPVGPAGPAGPKGATGPQGPKGADGAVGPQGPEGPAGPKGDTGPAGPAGPKGEDGAVGPQGPEGPAGPKGDTGPAGPAGSKGEDGAVGPQGHEGPAGPKGDTGPAGPAGPAGPKGSDGATPTFEVGSVTKLAPDAEPTVTLENVGGDLYMMDFGIPQGQPGTPGGGGGGGIEWIPVALENPTPAAVKSELNLYYDKADKTHLKLVGIFGTLVNGNYTDINLKLPYPNPLNYGESVYAVLPTISPKAWNKSSRESEFRNTLLYIEDRNFHLQRYNIYLNGYDYIVGTEFYVVKNVKANSPGLPGPTTPTDPTYPGPMEGPLNEHTAVE